MNLQLNYTGFERYLWLRNESIDGPKSIHYVFKFDNGYGASIVKNFGSYGYFRDLWGLAVIRFIDEKDYDMCYSTPITQDVCGYLTDADVVHILGRIRDLEV